MNKEVLKDNTKHIVLVQGLLFVLFLLITYFFNRFAVDDYYFIGENNSKPFLHSYKLDTPFVSRTDKMAELKKVGICLKVSRYHEVEQL